MRRFIGLIGAALLAACAGGEPLTTPRADPPSGSVRVLLVGPDAETASSRMPQQMRDRLMAAAEEFVIDRGHDYVRYQRRGSPAGARGRQAVRLHDAVADTVLAAKAGSLSLKSDREDVLARSLGPDANTLGRGYDADYALFLAIRGRVGAAAQDVAPLAVGGLVTTDAGQERDAVFSVVDLRSGDVVWFTTPEVRIPRDFQTPERSELLINTVLYEAPL